MATSDDLVRTQLVASFFMEFHREPTPDHTDEPSQCRTCLRAADAALLVFEPLLNAVEAACAQAQPGAHEDALHALWYLRIEYARLGFGNSDLAAWTRLFRARTVVGKTLGDIRKFEQNSELEPSERARVESETASIVEALRTAGMLR